MAVKKRLDDRIVETVCDCYGYSLEELRQPNGKHTRGVARKMLAYVLFKFTPHTSSWIALYTLYKAFERFCSRRNCSNRMGNRTRPHRTRELQTYYRHTQSHQRR